jgi:hypothetical protein
MPIDYIEKLYNASHCHSNKNIWDGICMNKKQNQQINQLKKETILWKQRYLNMLTAYFELHSYCNNIHKQNQLKN